MCSGLCHAICYFLKKTKMRLRIDSIPKTNNGPVLLLRLSSGIDTVSCRLLLRMGRMNMDSSLKNLDQIFRGLM